MQRLLVLARENEGTDDVVLQLGSTKLMIPVVLCNIRITSSDVTVAEEVLSFMADVTKAAESFARARICSSAVKWDPKPFREG
jgi:hypothetical protein